MTTPAPAPAPPQEGGGSVLQQRIGPFATWVWLLFATIGILIYAYLGSKKKAAATQATAGQAVGAQQVPDIIIQNQEPSETEPAAPTPPPGAVPPSSPPPPRPPIPPVKPPTRPPVKPPVKPPTGGGKPKFRLVKVARYTDENPPWNSTLWGIATHYGVKGGWQELMRLNGIKDPRKLRVGQEIRVPA